MNIAIEPFFCVNLESSRPYVPNVFTTFPWVSFVMSPLLIRQSNILALFHYTTKRLVGQIEPCFPRDFLSFIFIFSQLKVFLKTIPNRLCGLECCRPTRLGCILQSSLKKNNLVTHFTFVCNARKTECVLNRCPSSLLVFQLKTLPRL